MPSLLSTSPSPYSIPPMSRQRERISGKNGKKSATRTPRPFQAKAAQEMPTAKRVAFVNQNGNEEGSICKHCIVKIPTQTWNKGENERETKDVDRGDGTVEKNGLINEETEHFNDMNEREDYELQTKTRKQKSKKKEKFISKLLDLGHDQQENHRKEDVGRVKKERKTSKKEKVKRHVETATIAIQVSQPDSDYDDDNGLGDEQTDHNQLDVDERLTYREGYQSEEDLELFQKAKKKYQKEDNTLAELKLKYGNEDSRVVSKKDFAELDIKIHDAIDGVAPSSTPSTMSTISDFALATQEASPSPEEEQVSVKSKKKKKKKKHKRRHSREDERKSSEEIDLEGKAGGQLDMNKRESSGEIDLEGKVEEQTDEREDIRGKGNAEVKIIIQKEEEEKVENEEVTSNNEEMGYEDSVESKQDYVDEDSISNQSEDYGDSAMEVPVLESGPKIKQMLDLEDCRQFFKDEIMRLNSEVENFKTKCQEEMTAYAERMAFLKVQMSQDLELKHEEKPKERPGLPEEERLQLLERKTLLLKKNQELLDQEEHLMNKEEELSNKQKALLDYEADIQQIEHFLEIRYNMVKRREEGLSSLDNELRELSASLQKQKEDLKKNDNEEFVEKKVAKLNWNFVKKAMLEREKMLEGMLKRKKIELNSAESRIEELEIEVDRIKNEGKKKEENLKQLRAQLFLSAVKESPNHGLKSSSKLTDSSSTIGDSVFQGTNRQQTTPDPQNTVQNNHNTTKSTRDVRRPSIVKNRLAINASTNLGESASPKRAIQRKSIPDTNTHPGISRFRAITSAKPERMKSNDYDISQHGVVSSTCVMM